MSKKIESNMPWVEKYRPKSIKEMALPVAKVRGHRVDLADELINFVKGFFKEIEIINEKNKEIRAFNRPVTEKEQKDSDEYGTRRAGATTK